MSKKITDTERITVITLSYNNLEFYRDCLESVLQQDYENIEWILCDDASDDFEKYAVRIEDMLDEHSQKLQSVNIVHNEHNLGIIKNYRQAIDMAKGKYIFYLAIDDQFYDEHVLSDVVHYFQETGKDICTGYLEVISVTGETTGIVHPSVATVKLLKNKEQEKLLSRFMRVCLIAGANTPFRKSIVDKCGFVPEGYVCIEDWPRYLYYLEGGVSFGFIDKKLIKYRKGGVTTNILDEQTNTSVLDDVFRVCNKYMNAPYNNYLTTLCNRKIIIAWGASAGFAFCHKEWELLNHREVDFLVDKSKCLQGTVVEGIKVDLPDIIHEYDKKDIFVLVFSESYYPDIADELEKEFGLQEGEDFDIVSRATIVWQRMKNMVEKKEG